MAVSEILAALADETRRAILSKLKEGTISSGDLAAALHLSPQALSYHLSRLKKADLIYETRYKNFIYYELNLSVLDEAILWLSELRREERPEGSRGADGDVLAGGPRPGAVEGE